MYLSAFEGRILSRIYKKHRNYTRFCTFALNPNVDVERAGRCHF